MKLPTINWRTLALRVGFLAAGALAVALANYLGSTQMAGELTPVIVLALRDLDKYLERRAASPKV